MSDEIIDCHFCGKKDQKAIEVKVFKITCELCSQPTFRQNLQKYEKAIFEKYFNVLLANKKLDQIALFESLHVIRLIIENS